MNTCMDRTNTPADRWLLCIKYVMALENLISQATLGGKTPQEVKTGQQPDI